MKSYIVTRYISGELTTYVANNWNHVASLIAVGKIVKWELAI